MKIRPALAIPFSLALAPLTAQAGGPGVSIGGSAEASTDAAPAAEGDASADAPAAESDTGTTEYAPEGTTAPEWRKELESRKKWIKRWLPEKNTVELGVFGGLFIANPAHDFYNPDSAPQIPLWSLSPDVGLRVAYFPLTFLGVEVEGAAIPARIRTPDDDSAFLYGVRGHAILRAPWWRVSPFVLGGFGMMGVASDAALLGNDIDPVAHYGLGMQIFINRFLSFRLEGRHLLAAQEREQDNRTSHAEVLAGLSLTFGRKLPEVPPPPPPPPPPDRDGDTVADYDDACPDEAGLVELEGCPPPPDSDGDGIRDPDDKCPQEAGVPEYEGCPIPDTDGDGFLDPDDKCPNEPETKNGFEDDDGCADELPPEVEEFDGVIEGIYFETNSDKIRRKSRPTLDKAIAVLEKFPEVKIEVVGHTDDRGSREYNIDLSKRRAQAVVDYLVKGGIDASRLRSRGAGPDEPRVENDSKANRALNRRTEFHVLNQDQLSNIDKGEAKPEAKPEPEADPPTDAP